MKRIRVITKVERTAIENLQGMVRVSDTEVKIPSYIEWEAIAVKPHARLTCEDKIEDGVLVWTSTLSFKTCEELNVKGRYAYLCRLNNGTYRLIGTNNRPYPVTKYAETMPENVTDNQLTEVSVTWISAFIVPHVHQL